MKEQQAQALVARIPEEMPTVIVAIKPTKGGRGRESSYTLILQHKPTQLILSMWDANQWAEIKQVWQILEEKRA